MCSGFTDRLVTKLLFKRRIEETSDVRDVVLTPTTIGEVGIVRIQ